MEFRFCPFCANPLHTKVEDDKKRLYCDKCKKFHYKNPSVGVAVLLMEKNELLLVKRLGSYEGRWCIPCGYVEWDEDIRSAAQREIKEETGLEVMIGPVFTAHSNFHNLENQTVGIWFWGKRIGGKLQAGSDASEISFFPLNDLPQRMAFPTDLIVCEQLRSCLESDGLPQWID